MKKQRHYFANRGPSSQSYDFSSSHVWIWELDYKETWVLKNWCFWTVVLQKALKSPLDCKEIQPVHPKGNQSWIFIRRTDVEAETPILWPSDAKNWLIGKDLNSGKDWRQEEKGTTEDEMVGWHRWLNGHEFEWTPGVGDGQGSLVCCIPRGHKELDLTEWLNWTELRHLLKCNHLFLIHIYKTGKIFGYFMLRPDCKPGANFACLNYICLSFIIYTILCTMSYYLHMQKYMARI